MCRRCRADTIFMTDEIDRMCRIDRTDVIETLDRIDAMSVNHRMDVVDMIDRIFYDRSDKLCAQNRHGRMDVF